MEVSLPVPCNPLRFRNVAKTTNYLPYCIKTLGFACISIEKDYLCSAKQNINLYIIKRI